MASTAVTSRPVALGLVLLLGLAVLLNYVDRGAIAIAAPLLKPELGLSATEFGLAVSAFFWVYAPIQYFVGWACDRWCVYRLLAAGIALWAVSTMLMGLAGGLASLVVLRLLLGLGESITFPGASKVIARHVAPEQRGIANSAIAMGIALGPVVGTLAGGLIVASYGWRPMFVIFGGLTLFWIIPWLKAARRLPSFSTPGQRSPRARRQIDTAARIVGDGDRPFLRHLQPLFRRYLAPALPRPVAGPDYPAHDVSRDPRVPRPGG